MKSSNQSSFEKQSWLNFVFLHVVFFGSIMFMLIDPNMTVVLVLLVISGFLVLSGLFFSSVVLFKQGTLLSRFILSAVGIVLLSTLYFWWSENWPDFAAGIIASNYGFGLTLIVALGLLAVVFKFLLHWKKNIPTKVNLLLQYSIFLQSAIILFLIIINLATSVEIL